MLMYTIVARDPKRANRFTSIKIFLSAAKPHRQIHIDCSMQIFVSFSLRVFFCHVYDKLSGVAAKRASYIAFAENIFFCGRSLNRLVYLFLCWLFAVLHSIEWSLQSHDAGTQVHFLDDSRVFHFGSGIIFFLYTQCCGNVARWIKKSADTIGMSSQWILATKEIYTTFTQSGYRR